MPTIGLAEHESQVCLPWTNKALSAVGPCAGFGWFANKVAAGLQETLRPGRLGTLAPTMGILAPTGLSLRGETDTVMRNGATVGSLLRIPSNESFSSSSDDMLILSPSESM